MRREILLTQVPTVKVLSIDNADEVMISLIKEDQGKETHIVIGSFDEVHQALVEYRAKRNIEEIGNESIRRHQVRVREYDNEHK